MPDTLHGAAAVAAASSRRPAGTLDVADITNSLRSLMVRNMGIIRDRAGLAEAAARRRPSGAATCWRREFDDRAGWELQNLLTSPG